MFAATVQPVLDTVTTNQWLIMGGLFAGMGGVLVCTYYALWKISGGEW